MVRFKGMNNAQAKGAVAGMMLETDPMPGTRRAEALTKSNVPTPMEVIGGPRRIPRFLIIGIFGSMIAYAIWVITSIALGA